MPLYKICPSCGHRNMPKEQDCALCGYDLYGVQAEQIAEPMADASQAAETKKEMPAASVGRRCNGCGTISPITFAVCPNCKSSLSSAAIVPITETASPSPKSAWHLTSVDQEADLQIAEGESHLVGREHALSEYLEGFCYVGRLHAEVKVSDGRFFITDKHSTNGVQVNYVSIPAGEETELKDDDLVSLGGKRRQMENGVAYFNVRRA